MNEGDLILAQAASRLTVEDFDWLCRDGVVSAPAVAADKPPQKCVTVTHRVTASRREATSQGVETATQPEPHSQEPGSQPRSQKKHRARRSTPHAWPDVGTILSADYFGTRYEAEVVEARRYKNGRALKILTGPAAGKIFSSMSGAMLAATESQRQEQNLGHKGISNGWRFWKPAKGARA